METVSIHPEIGHPQSYYAQKIHDAEKAEDHLALVCAKVGQYVTLAMDPNLAWAQKQRYFEHILHRHLTPPPWADDDARKAYAKLADVVRDHAGQEALRLACAEDDLYAAREGMGADRKEVENDADAFFSTLIPSACPSWLHPQDYAQLAMIRDQWI